MRVTAWMWGAGLLLPIGGVAGIFLWPGSNVSAPIPLVAAGPIAQITAPAPGFKLREGQTMAVRIRVKAGDQPLQSWSLKLSGPGHPDEQLASGVLPVDDQPVAQVAADGLTLGEQYQLILNATDVAGGTAQAELALLVPDPQYTLIPLEPGNFSRTILTGVSVDDSGHVISFGGEPAARGLNWDVFILNTASGTLRTLGVPVGNSSAGLQLSADGNRFFFKGVTGIDFFDLDTGNLIHGPETSSFLFSFDRTGHHIAYQAPDPNIPDSTGGSGGSLQYYLYDTDSQEAREITQDPQAIVYDGGNPAACPQTFGTTPIISADGSTVVLVTRATFGLAPADASVGCHIFTYDVPSGALHHVRSFPAQTALDMPKLSDDGGWLSFDESHIVPQGFRRDFGALLDLRTGGLTDPLGDIENDPTFDAVISADSSTIVVSTTADLDQRVGNADRNFELFAYDLATARFTQISDTTGGISGGSCDRFTPAVNSDARVVLFSFNLLSTEGCQVRYPRRNGSDDLVLGRVRAVRRRPGNHPPVLQPLASVRGLAGETFSLQFSATDTDGDPIVFFAQSVGELNIPPGSQIVDHHDGTATLTWPTLPEQAGLYFIRVAAFDEGGGETFADTTIAVCNRIVHDGDLAGVVVALFESRSPAPCHDADLNRDARLTASDIVEAVGPLKV